MAIVLIALASAVPARAERFGIVIGDTPPTIVSPPDPGVGLDLPAAVEPAGDVALDPPPPLPAPPPPPDALRTETAAATPDRPGAPRPSLRLDWSMVSAPSTRPEPRYADLCRQYYDFDDVQIERAWRYFDRDNAALSYETRMGNSCIRMVVTESRRAGKLDPAFLRVPQPTVGVMRTSASHRGMPWGSSMLIGGERKVQPGKTVQLLDRSGPFFRVEIDGVPAWLPGTHMDVR